jgi:SAM-dependent methyltransferase
MAQEKPVYHGIADSYAQVVDSKPQNAYYERPATLSMLPPLNGLRVLDVGCGSGWYAQHMLEQGAEVTSFDAEPRFVELTRKRVGNRARVLLADLAKPLDFALPESFDLIVCPLVLHYVADWKSVFSEFRRVLRAGGVLVFSTHHPYMDWQNFDTGDYFRIELLEDDWDVGKVRFYRRPLTSMSEDLAASGFLIERILEPRPTPDYRDARPDWYEKLMTHPWFLVIRARLEGKQEQAT